MLSDRGSFVASTYGVAFALSRADRVLFSEIGNDLAQSNGDNSWLLPAPASFVIAGDGVIRHARVDPDYTSRIDPNEIVDILRMIAAEPAPPHATSRTRSVR